MSFDWNAHFGSLSGQPPFSSDAADIANFGAIEDQLEAARSGTIAAPLGHLGLIACAGSDAADFLHNQLTSDVTHLAADRAQHSAWCTPKGRMLASFLVFRHEDAYFLQLADELVEPILKRLRMFVLRAKVDISERSAALIGISGPRAEESLQAAGLPVPTEPLTAASSSAGPVIRLGEQRFEVVIAAGQLADIWQRLTTVATPVGVEAWRWLDIQDGLPTITNATREEFVPQMANFDQLGGVSFHKGCYPGQEVIARTQYLGKVKRHLYRVAADTAMAPGMPLYSIAAPDQVCGQVVNAAPAPGGGNVALAVLQENAAGGAIHLHSPDGPLLTAATPLAQSSMAAN